MSEQLTLLDDLGAPKLWRCPSCHGSRKTLQVLYPDEARELGRDSELRPCRTCCATGTVGYDPDDHTEIPF